MCDLSLIKEKILKLDSVFSIITEKNQQLKTEKEAHNKLYTEYLEKCNDYERLQNEYDVYKTEYTGLTGSSEEAKSTIETLQSNLSTLKIAYDSHEDTIQEFKKKELSLVKQLNKLKERLGKKDETIAELKKSFKAPGKGAGCLKKRAEELERSKREELEGENGKLKSNNEELREECDTLVGENVKLSESIIDLQLLKDGNVRLNDEIKELQLLKDKNVTLDDKIKELQQLKDVNVRLNEKIKELQVCEGENVRLRDENQELQVLTDKCGRLKGENLRLSEENQKIPVLVDKFESLKQENVKLSEKNEEFQVLKGKYEKLLEEIKRLQRDNTDLKNSVEVTEAKSVKDVATECSSLEDVKNCLQCELNRNKDRCCFEGLSKISTDHEEDNSLNFLGFSANNLQSELDQLFTFKMHGDLFSKEEIDHMLYENTELPEIMRPMKSRSNSPQNQDNTIPNQTQVIEKMLKDAEIQTTNSSTSFGTQTLNKIIHSSTQTDDNQQTIANYNKQTQTCNNKRTKTNFSQTVESLEIRNNKKCPKCEDETSFARRNVESQTCTRSDYNEINQNKTVVNCRNTETQTIKNVYSKNCIQTQTENKIISEQSNNINYNNKEFDVGPDDCETLEKPRKHLNLKRRPTAQNKNPKITIKKAVNALKRSKIDITLKAGRLVRYNKQVAMRTKEQIQRRMERNIMDKIIAYIHENLGLNMNNLTQLNQFPLNVNQPILQRFNFNQPHLESLTSASDSDKTSSVINVDCKKGFDSGYTSGLDSFNLNGRRSTASSLRSYVSSDIQNDSKKVSDFQHDDAMKSGYVSNVFESDDSKKVQHKAATKSGHVSSYAENDDTKKVANVQHEDTNKPDYISNKIEQENVSVNNLEHLEAIIACENQTIVNKTDALRDRVFNDSSDDLNQTNAELNVSKSPICKYSLRSSAKKIQPSTVRNKVSNISKSARQIFPNVTNSASVNMVTNESVPINADILNSTKMSIPVKGLKRSRRVSNKSETEISNVVNDTSSECLDSLQNNGVQIQNSNTVKVSKCLDSLIEVHISNSEVNGKDYCFNKCYNGDKNITMSNIEIHKVSDSLKEQMSNSVKADNMECDYIKTNIINSDLVKDNIHMLNNVEINIVSDSLKPRMPSSVKVHYKECDFKKTNIDNIQMSKTAKDENNHNFDFNKSKNNDRNSQSSNTVNVNFTKEEKHENLNKTKNDVPDFSKTNIQFSNTVLNKTKHDVSDFLKDDIQLSDTVVDKYAEMPLETFEAKSELCADSISRKREAEIMMAAFEFKKKILDDESDNLNDLFVNDILKEMTVYPKAVSPLSGSEELSSCVKNKPSKKKSRKRKSTDNQEEINKKMCEEKTIELDKMKICPICRTELNVNDNYCHECFSNKVKNTDDQVEIKKKMSEEKTTELDKVKMCPDCRNELNINDNYCKECLLNRVKNVSIFDSPNKERVLKQECVVEKQNDNFHRRPVKDTMIYLKNNADISDLLDHMENDVEDSSNKDVILNAETLRVNQAKINSSVYNIKDTSHCFDMKPIRQINVLSKQPSQLNINTISNINNINQVINHKQPSQTKMNNDMSNINHISNIKQTNTSNINSTIFNIENTRHVSNNKGISQTDINTLPYSTNTSVNKNNLPVSNFLKDLINQTKIDTSLSNNKYSNQSIVISNEVESNAKTGLREEFCLPIMNEFENKKSEISKEEKYTNSAGLNQRIDNFTNSGSDVNNQKDEIEHSTLEISKCKSNETKKLEIVNGENIVENVKGDEPTKCAPFVKNNICASAIKSMKPIVLKKDKPTGKRYPERKKVHVPWDTVKTAFKNAVRFKGVDEYTVAAMRTFKTIDKQRLVSYLLHEVIEDKCEVQKGQSPFEPFLSVTHRTVIGLLLHLEKSHDSSMVEYFLTTCEQQLLFKENDPLDVEQIARIYSAICKMRRCRNRLRRLILDGLFFMGDFVLPLIYYTLTVWLEVLKKNDSENDDIKDPFSKILFQVVMTKSNTQGEFCLSPLKNMLKIYYRYPKERYFENNLLKEFLECYMCTLSKKYEFAILILCKNNKKEWVVRQLALLEELILIVKKEDVISGLKELNEKMQKLVDR